MKQFDQKVRKTNEAYLKNIKDDRKLAESFQRSHQNYGVEQYMMDQLQRIDNIQNQVKQGLREKMLLADMVKQDQRDGGKDQQSARRGRSVGRTQTVTGNVFDNGLRQSSKNKRNKSMKKINKDLSLDEQMPSSKDLKLDPRARRHTALQP